MTMHFRTRRPDGPDIVHSSMPGYYYRVRDLAGLDRDIANLRDSLTSPSLTDFARAQWRRDIDRLLDRRLYLMKIGVAA